MVFNYARNADAPIHRAFFEQMARLHVDDEPPPSRVTVDHGTQGRDRAVRRRRGDVARVGSVGTSGRRARASSCSRKAITVSVADAEAIRDAIVEAAS